MPRLVDWGARNDLICEAVVRLAARGGAGAVTLAAVATELHVSTATLRRALAAPDVLPELGARWIARERHHRRYLRGLPSGVERGSVQHAVWLLKSELPGHEDELEQERAWTQLVHRGATESIVELQQDDDVFVEELVRRVLALLEAEEATRGSQAVMLRALLDGLTVALCGERTTLEEAVACLETYLASTWLG